MSVYWNNITSPAGQVTVRTPIEGSASVWYVTVLVLWLYRVRLT